MDAIEYHKRLTDNAMPKFYVGQKVKCSYPHSRLFQKTGKITNVARANDLGNIWIVSWEDSVEPFGEWWLEPME